MFLRTAFVMSGSAFVMSGSAFVMSGSAFVMLNSTVAMHNTPLFGVCNTEKDADLDFFGCLVGRR